MFSLGFSSSSHSKHLPESSLPACLLIPKYPLRPYAYLLVDSLKAMSPPDFRASDLALQKSQSILIRTQCLGHRDHPALDHPRRSPILCLLFQRYTLPECLPTYACVARTRSTRTACTHEKGPASPPSLATLTYLSNLRSKNNESSLRPPDRTSVTRGTASMRLQLSHFGSCSTSLCLDLNALRARMCISLGR